ncbi:hypothetical protein E2562_000500, partial [Oryza meyeriana var. granulata]
MAAAAADSSLPGGQAEDMAPMGEEEEERLATLLGIAEECDTEDELRLLLRGNPYPVCYDSFQPTSRMTHRPAEIDSRPDEYWPRVMDIGTQHKAGFVRQLKDNKMPTAQIFSPCMQSAGIFFLQADICQMGMDQQEVNKLATAYSVIKQEKKPIILSHHLLPGLKGQHKMSTSDPSSAIFMDDDKPVRELFENNKEAKFLRDTVKGYSEVKSEEGMASGSEAEKSPEVVLEWPKKDKKRLLHAVYRVGDLDRTIKCYTECFGMKLLRKRDVPDEKYTNAFLGFGPEETNFALELTY